MKNIPFFPVLVIMLCAVASQYAVAEEGAKNRSYAFSLIPQFGFFFGQAEEIVYPYDTSGEYLSELLWDMKPLVYYGAELDFSLVNPMEKPGFFVKLSAKIGIPGNTGVMEDRDWKSAENDRLTNFSSHTNNTREMYAFGLSAGVSLPGKSVLYTRFFLDLQFMRFAFTGHDGYAQYAREKGNGAYYPINDKPYTGTFSGEVITYSQEWLIIAPGFSLGYPFLDRFVFEFFFKSSPLIFCADVDEHLLNETVYRDYTTGGLLLEPGGQLDFSFSRRFSLSLVCAWRLVAGSRGDLYTKKLKSGQGYSVSSNMAGTGLSVLDMALRFHVRF